MNGLEITPCSALLFTGSVGGTVNPAMLAFTLTNRVGFPVRTVGQDVAWLSASPTFGFLVAGGPAVSVAPNLLTNNLPAGTYNATLFFTNLTAQTVQRHQVTLGLAGLPVITPNRPMKSRTFPARANPSAN